MRAKKKKEKKRKGRKRAVQGVYCVDLGDSFQMSIYYLLANIGFDTAEGEKSKVELKKAKENLIRRKQNAPLRTKRTELR